MPQAIKEFSGHVTSGNATVYTCPANTVSLILPSFTYFYKGSGDGDKFSIKWKGSASTDREIGNLTFGDLGGNYSVSGVSLSKYDIEVAIPQNYSVQAMFTPGPCTTTRASNSAAYLGGGSNLGNSYNSGLVKSGSTYGTPGYNTSTYNAFNKFKTGAWAMGPGDVLSYYLGSSSNTCEFSYTFLILEESGS